MMNFGWRAKPVVFHDAVTTVSMVLFGVSVGTEVSGVVEAEKAERQQKRAGRERTREFKRQAEGEREQGRRLRSTQRAAFGAAGVKADFGSSAALQFRGVLDSIDLQDAILRGAVADEKAIRQRARANTVNAYTTAISNVANTVGRTDFSAFGNSTVPGQSSTPVSE